MRAIVISKYGAPEHLQLQEVQKPIPKENEVLVRICATAVNDYDWSMVRGRPRIYRLMFGLFNPKQKHRTPGMELAGIIEETGSNAKKFAIGDVVFGDTSDFGFGTFAEYISIHEDALVHKPENMSFEEATSLPHASLLAYQGLENYGELKEGMNVLLNGAGGGVGTIAFQLAKLKSCTVTGVDTGEKLKAMRSMGFDHIIDYRKEDFTRNGKRYDLILDCKTTRSPGAYLRSLESNGKYVTVGGKLGKIFSLITWGRLRTISSDKQLKVLPLKPNKGLDHISDLFIEGKLECVIDGPYPLEDTPRLLRYFGEGKHTGKVVIKVD